MKYTFEKVKSEKKRNIREYFFNLFNAIKSVADDITIFAVLYAIMLSAPINPMKKWYIGVRTREP